MSITICKLCLIILIVKTARMNEILIIPALYNKKSSEQ